MKTAVFQCAAAGLNPEQRVSRLAEAISGRTLDLIVCPELFASGYNVGTRLVEAAESLNGDFQGRMARLAQETGTALIFGFPERDGDQLYNSACCIDRNGKRIATRRKLLLPPGFEGDHFAPGNIAPDLFDIGGIRCAILICFEVEFPEAVRAMAQAGAHLIAVPTALASQWHVVAHRLVPTRSFENGVWLAYANHAGTEDGFSYLGASCIVGPDGIDRVRAGDGEALISATIDVSAVKAAQDRLPYLRHVGSLRRKLNPGAE